MDLVIRLKRPRNVDPFEALVLASKRRKKDENSEGTASENEHEPTVLQFAGTLNYQGEDITPHILKAREQVGMKSMDHLKSKTVVNKTRSAAMKASKENRLKVINMSRALSDALLDHNYAGPENKLKSTQAPHFTIVDVIHDDEEGSCKDTQVEEDDQYVYSLYFANSAGGEMNDGFLESLVSVEPLDTSCVHLYDYRDHNDEDSIPDEEDDSNDENNWRNDYPDSDPDNERGDSDVSVEFMMDNIKLDSENELSSDDEDVDIPYGVDAEDVFKLGRGYAQYKAKVMRELDDDDDERSCPEVSSASEADD